MASWLGYALAATALWGVWAVAARCADTAGVPPYLVQALLPVGLLPVAAVLLARPGPAGPAPGRGAAWSVATGWTAGVGNVLFFEALRLGPAAVVAPLTAVFPLVTLGLAVGLLRERPNWVQGVGVALAVASVVAFNLPAAGARTGATGPADWLAPALAAVGLWGVSNFFQKLAVMSTSDARATLWFCAAFAVLGAVLVGVRPPEWSALTGAGWGLTIVVGVLNGLAVLAAFAAYRTGQASVVTPLIAMNPAVTVALAVPLFDEQVSGRGWIGVALALAAGVALAYQPVAPD